MALKLKEALQDGLIAAFQTHSWPTYDGGSLDRSKFLTASEAAVCARKLMFSKLDVAPSAGSSDPTGIFIRGHVVEGALVEGLLQGLPEGWEVHGVSDAQVSYYDDELAMSGTPDGFLLHRASGQVLPLEFKSTDPRTNIAAYTDAKPAHKAQLKINAFLMRRCWERRPDLRPEGYRRFGSVGFVFYADCNDLLNLRVFEVDIEAAVAGSDSMVTSAIHKADALIGNLEDMPVGIVPSMTVQDHFPASGIIDGTCRYCDFKAECTAYNTKTKKTPGVLSGGSMFFAGGRLSGKTALLTAPMGAVEPNSVVVGLNGEAITIDEVDATIGGYLERKRDAKFGADAEDVAKAQLLKLLENFGVDGSLEGRKYMASVGVTPGSMTLDKAALTDVLGEEYMKGFMKQNKPSVRLTAKEIDAAK